MDVMGRNCSTLMLTCKPTIFQGTSFKLTPTRRTIPESFKYKKHNIVPSLPNAFSEGVLGRFLGSSHTSKNKVFGSLG